MRNDKNNIVKRKRDVLLALLVVTLMIFGCITNVFAVGEDETESSQQQVTEQTEPQTSQEPTTEATEPPTQATTEAPTTEATTEATEPTTVQETTEATQSTTYEELTEVTEATTEGNPWDFEVPTEGTIEAEQTKADYFTGTVMWSAVGGGLLILLIMFIGKRKY